MIRIIESNFNVDRVKRKSNESLVINFRTVSVETRIDVY